MAMVLTIPVILDDYYETIEQNLFTTSNTQILDDCDYIIGEIAIGEWWDDYKKADIVALKRLELLSETIWKARLFLIGSDRNE